MIDSETVSVLMAFFGVVFSIGFFFFGNLEYSVYSAWISIIGLMFIRR